MQVQFMPIKIRNIGEINCVDYFEVSQKKKKKYQVFLRAKSVFAKIYFMHALFPEN